MSATYTFDQFTPDHLQRIREGIKCFNEQKYWECHEVLEDIWLEERNDPARLITWAIIQVAAAMVHYREKNLAGVQGMLVKAREKLQRAQAQKVETDVVYQYLSWQKLKDLLFQIPGDAGLEEHQALYDFRFEDYPW